LLDALERLESAERHFQVRFRRRREFREKQVRPESLNGNSVGAGDGHAI
jgi:hypothetical protein